MRSGKNIPFIFRSMIIFCKVSKIKIEFLFFFFNNDIQFLKNFTLSM